MIYTFLYIVSLTLFWTYFKTIVHKYKLINRVTIQKYETLISSERLTTGTNAILWSIENYKRVIIHSILHINGYSHNNDKYFSMMKNKEIKILNKLGISSPYL